MLESGQLDSPVENNVGIKPSRPRKTYIDVARGIAIISIILAHSDIATNVVFTYNVMVFFIISGLFMDDQGPVLKFVKRRFRALLVPYFITCAILIVSAMIKGGITGGDFLTPGKEWAAAALYGSGSNQSEPFPVTGIGPVWFLWASFFACCLVRLLLKTKPYIRIPVIFLAFLYGYLTSRSVFLPFSIQPGLCCALFVYVGYLIGKEKDHIIKLGKETRIICLIVMSVIWIAFMVNFKDFWVVICNFGNVPSDIFASICGTMVVLAISYFIDRYLKIISKFLSAVGKNSLLVLCVHTLEFNLFPNRVLPNIPFLDFRGQIIVMVILEIIIDIVIGLALSKIKVVRKAFGMKA